MHIPRFYVTDIREPLTDLPESEARHARSSLRLGHGDAVELFDGRGKVAAGVVEMPGGMDRLRGKTARELSVRVHDVRRVPAPQRTLTLIVAGCKGARLDWLIEKCTELSVTRIVLAEFERSVVHVNPGHTDRLLRTAIEACKQCGRNRLPEILAGLSLADAIAAASGQLLVCEPTGANEWSAALTIPGGGETTAVVGPEGGLSGPELETLQQRGGKLIRLTPEILRIETAAICVASIWAAHLSHA